MAEPKTYKVESIIDVKSKSPARWEATATKTPAPDELPAPVRPPPPDESPSDSAGGPPAFLKRWQKKSTSSRPTSSSSLDSYSDRGSSSSIPPWETSNVSILIAVYVLQFLLVLLNKI